MLLYRVLSANLLASVASEILLRRSLLCLLGEASSPSWRFLDSTLGLSDREDSLRGHCEAGSLTGAVHLSNDNAGVLRPAQ